MADIAELEFRVSAAKALTEQQKLQAALRRTGQVASGAAAQGTKGMAGFGMATTATAAKVGLLNKQLTFQLGILGRMVGLFLGFTAIRGVVGTIAEFEKTLSGVEAVTGSSREEMERLTASARELGKTTVFSASQAAQGMEALGLAGFKTQEILDAIPGTLALAAAGSLDLESASRITANTLRAFNMEASEAGRVADVLAVGATNANQTVQDLGDGMKFVAPVFKQLGFSVEQAAASLSILANSGLAGGESGTTLRMVMRSMLKVAPEAERVLDKYGLTVQEINPAVVGLSESLERLAEVQISATDAASIFQARAMAGGAIMTTQIDDLKEMLKLTNDAAGAAERMAKVKLDNLAGDWRLLVSAAQELTLALGDNGGVQGGLRSLTQNMTEFIRGANDGFNTMKLFVVTTWNSIANIIDSVLTGVFYLLGQLVGIVATTGLAIKGIFQVNFVGIRGLWNETIQFMVRRLLDFAKVAGKVASVLPDALGGSAIEEGIDSMITKLETKLVPGTKGPIDEVASLIGSIGDEMEEVIGGTGAFGDTMAENLFGRMIERAQAEKNAVEQLAAGMSTSLKEIAEEAAPKPTDPMKEEPRDLVDRLGTADMTARMIQDKIFSIRASLNDEAWIRDATVDDFKSKIEEMEELLNSLDRKFQGSSVNMVDAFTIGYQQMLDSWGTTSQRMAVVGQTLASSIDQNITDGLMGIIDGTMSVGEAFQQMAKQIISDLIRVMIQQLIVRSIMTAFGGMGGGGGVGGLTAGAVQHSGGMIGQGGTPMRAVGSQTFSGAKRYQMGGVAGDEVPVIAHRGEGIFTEEQMSALGEAVRGGQSRKVEVVNVTDPRMVDERLAQNPDAILNVINKNRTAVRQTLGIT